MKYNEAILSAAADYLGLKEWPGATHNPKVVAMFSTVGHSWVKDDETPWCAAFVGAVLASLGLPHTGALNARSYLKWGAVVQMQDARPGDLVILWRGSKTGWQGHVAFLVEFDGNRAILRGGNQGNAVTDQAYPLDRILGIRRADNVVAGGIRAVLRKGDRGNWVLDLQSQLVSLGYTLGQKDSAFGTRTLAAVVAFQAENGLIADGIVGDRTWAALASASSRQGRPVEMSDLESKSRTVAAAKEGQTTVGVGVTMAGAGVVMSQIEGAIAIAQQADGLLAQALGLAPMILSLVVLAVVGFLIWKILNKVKAIRLDDAQTGANDRI
jgi:uncharacterized protein (TIGR02594 family)